MHIFFEIIKWLYFALTAVVGFFFLRGQTVLSPEQFVMIKTLIMPGYLVMCGIMIGYTLASIWIAKFDHNPAFVNQVSTKGFIVGLVLGIGMGLLYVAMH